MATHRVLFVDDEPNVLSGIRRSLRGDFEVATACSGDEALTQVQGSETFSVIVSDCRMPEMDGVELLARVSKASPDTTRIMLTGNTDQETAVRAVNRGEVFRFLNKPCDPEELKTVVRAAIRHYELVTAERVLLDQTLKGSIKVMSDLLGLVKPDAFGRVSRIRKQANQVADAIDGVRRWELDTAALLCQLGFVSIPQSTLDKLRTAEKLSPEESKAVAEHPSVVAELISNIPRMENVANIILYQNKHYDGSNYPEDAVKGTEIPLESRILGAVLGHDELAGIGWSGEALVQQLRSQKGRFDPALLDVLAEQEDDSESVQILRVNAHELAAGMVIEEDVLNQHGTMLISRGQEVTDTIRRHMMRNEESGALQGLITVSVPTATSDDEPPQ